MIIKQRDPSTHLGGNTIGQIFGLQTGNVPDSFLIYIDQFIQGTQALLVRKNSCGMSFKKQTISIRTSMELWSLIICNLNISLGPLGFCFNSTYRVSFKMYNSEKLKDKTKIGNYFQLCGKNVDALYTDRIPPISGPLPHCGLETR